MFRSTFYMRTGTQRKIYRKSNDFIQERSSWV